MMHCWSIILGNQNMYDISVCMSCLKISKSIEHGYLQGGGETKTKYLFALDKL